MRGVIVLLAVASCRYADSSIDEGFSCDAEHACADGQTCIAGTCRTGTDLLFFDGWENRTELGCDQNALIDRDFNTMPPADTGFLTTPALSALCMNPDDNNKPDAEVIEDIGPKGSQTRMLHVRQARGKVNGTAFTVDKMLSAPQTDVYAAWSVMYSPDWQWAAADHSIFVIEDPTMLPVISFGVEGRNDSSPGFVRIHVETIDADDQVFDAMVGQMSVGVWHLCELHVVLGPPGKVEARVDHEPVPFPAVNEVGTSILDLDIATTSFAGGKVDTTYAAGGFLDDRMPAMSPWSEYYDDVRMGAGIGFEQSPN